MTYFGAFGILCQLLMNCDNLFKIFQNNNNSNIMVLIIMLNARVMVRAPYTLIPKEQGGTSDMKDVFA